MSLFGSLTVFLLFASSQFFRGKAVLDEETQFFVQFVAEADPDELWFDQVIMNVRGGDNTIFVDMEIQRKSLLQPGETEIYQLTDEKKVYKSKYLDTSARQQFLDEIRLYDETTWKDATINDVESVSLQDCINDINSETSIYDSFIAGTTALEDGIYQHSDGRIVIHYLNREWVLDEAQGEPTVVYISTQSEEYAEAKITFYQRDTSEGFKTHWSIPLPDAQVCKQLSEQRTDSLGISFSVQVKEDDVVLETRRRLYGRTTGPCRANMCCPDNLQSSCDLHKQLFMLHDTYEDVDCPAVFFGNSCQRYSAINDNSMICRGTNKCYVSFAGSNDALDVLNSLHFASKEWEGYTVHSGFVTEFEGYVVLGQSISGIGLLTYLNLGSCLTYSSIDITGHSLGGAMAIMLGTYISNRHPNIDINVITYGSPRVFRSTNRPPASRYTQTSFINELVKDTWPISYYLDLASYMPPGINSWAHPVNTLTVRLCHVEDLVCRWVWPRFICVTNHYYFSKIGPCSTKFSIFHKAGLHFLPGYYHHLDKTNFAGC